MTDLTERLAAKLAEDVYPSSLWAEKPAHVSFHEIASIAHDWLPLLLSEPELVAGLAPEAKAAVLRTLLGERLEQMADPEGDLMVSGWREDGERGSVWVTVPFLRDLLAPLEAP